MMYSNDTTGGEQSPELPESIHELMQAGLEMKLHMVQHHARLAYLRAEEILRNEMMYVTGEKYERDKPFGGRYHRWGTNPGSVRIDRERVPIRVPRVRDIEDERERPLESHQHLKKGIDIDEKLEKSILLGLSTRDYAGLAGSILDGFGLSQSSVSRAFQERSAKALETFEELGRSLKTTNSIESLNSQLGKYLRRVKHWMHSDQRQRWVAMGILEAEKKMGRIQHWEKLPMLRAALQENIKRNQTKNAVAESVHEVNSN